jgi:hypothetical protein
MTELGPETQAPHEGKPDFFVSLSQTHSQDLGTVPVDHDPNFHATIDRLPNEVLELIFISYLGLDNPTNCRYYPTVKFELEYGPLSQHVLTAVSARWKALTESTPKLWSYIGFNSMDFSYLLESERICYVKRLDILLRHSKDYPLNVSIDMYLSQYQDAYELGCIAIKSLFAQSSRWRSATLWLGGIMTRPCKEDYRRKLSIRWPASFPQLEALTIGNHGGFTIASLIGDHGGILLNTPNLKRLEFDYFRFQELPYLQFPFSQIQALELPDWSRQEVLQILQVAPRLDYLRITLQYDSDGILSAPIKIFCRELVLTVCYRRSGDRGYFPPGTDLEILHLFERVQFVGMKSITLRSEARQWTVALIQGFLQSVQSSMSDLTCLTLRNLAFDDKDLISLLSLLPSLQTLRIFEHPSYDAGYPDVNGAFFLALTVPQADSSENVSSTSTAFTPTPTVIVPQLRELVLEIRTPWFRRRFMGLLVNMVHTRPRLRLLRVDYGQSYISRAGQQPMKGIVEELKLRLLSCRPDFRIQGSESRFSFELRSIHRS